MNGWRIMDLPTGYYYVSGQFEFTNRIGKVYTSLIHVKKRRNALERHATKYGGYSKSPFNGPFKVFECEVKDL